MTFFKIEDSRKVTNFTNPQGWAHQFKATNLKGILKETKGILRSSNSLATLQWDVLKRSILSSMKSHSLNWKDYFLVFRGKKTLNEKTEKMLRTIDKIAWREFSKQQKGPMIVKFGSDKQRYYQGDGTYYSLRTGKFNENGNKRKISVEARKAIYVATKHTEICEDGVRKDQKTSVAAIANFSKFDRKISDKESYNNIINESKILKAHQSSNEFVKLEALFQTKNKAILFEEYCNQGDLRSFLKQNSFFSYFQSLFGTNL